MGIVSVSYTHLDVYKRQECYTFFEDVCTVNELLSLSQRFEVATVSYTHLDVYKRQGEIGVYFAPGRVNMIGEHTD